MSYRGIYNVSFDSKGRFHWPPGLHSDPLDRFVATADIHARSILIYSRNEWKHVESQLRNLPDVNKNVRRIKLLMLGYAVECETDKSGRFLIPPTLRDYMRLSDECVMIGQGNKLSLWNPSEFRSYLSSSDESVRNAVEIIKKHSSKLSEDISSDIKNDELPYHVFISYSSIDKVFASKLASDLQSQKLNVWIDSMELLPGDSLFKKIQFGIDQSYYFIVILSPDSVSSKWCKKELNQAFSVEMDRDSVFIIPLLYRSCDIPGFLREKLYVDFESGSYQEGIDKILSRLKPNKRVN
ncbi:MAG: division/cell wall cluster transcriptional repressor MraZ [Pseudomonadales bacterium]|nr:division/cell wall cluster transcriptional repressor MraZ [Pseudomonadales bacterium]